MSSYVAAIDQGTTSTRCMIFDHSGRVVAVDQKEHEQIFPKAGWVEHDAEEIWENTREVAAGAVAKADLHASGHRRRRHHQPARDRRWCGTGPPASRCTTRSSGRTPAPTGSSPSSATSAAARTGTSAKVGLPLATYFSGPKVKWILDNVEGAREKAEAGDLLFGNMDTWVLWNMTGGADGGVHVTDPTNASRTMLMDLDTLQWDAEIAAEMGIPLSMLPEIRSSSEEYGKVRETGRAGRRADRRHPRRPAGRDVRPGLPFARRGQEHLRHRQLHAAQHRHREGDVSENGLLTTVCYKIGSNDTVYALEGSIAVTGSLVQWLRDNLGMIATAAEIEDLARSVEDNGGAYFVPAFSGLFAPYWRSDARGAIVGLTRFVNKGHLARAVLEATAFQTREVIDAMNADSGCPADVAEGRRRHGRQRAADAVPGRHPRRAGDPAGGHRDHRAGRRLRRRPGGRVLEVARTTSAPTGPRTSSGTRRWTTPAASASTATGRRPSPRPSTGSTTRTDRLRAGGAAQRLRPAAGGPSAPSLTEAPPSPPATP